jgi:DNA-directed RNA polymerase specialized sigma24 family protein
MQLHPYSTMQSTTVVSYIDGHYRYAMSITRNPTDAEDLVQETHVRAIPAMGSLDLGPGTNYARQAYRSHDTDADYE